MKNKLLNSAQALKVKYPYYVMNIENTRYTDQLEKEIDKKWASANLKTWCYMCGDKIYAGSKGDIGKIGSVLRSIFSIEELKKDREKANYEVLNYGDPKKNPYFNVF
jgi:hypothetical protein